MMLDLVLSLIHMLLVLVVCHLHVVSPGCLSVTCNGWGNGTNRLTITQTHLTLFSRMQYDCKLASLISVQSTRQSVQLFLGAVHKLRHFKIDLYGYSNNDSIMMNDGPSLLSLELALK